MQKCDLSAGGFLIVTSAYKRKKPDFRSASTASRSSTMLSNTWCPITRLKMHASGTRYFSSPPHVPSLHHFGHYSLWGNPLEVSNAAGKNALATRKTKDRQFPFFRLMFWRRGQCSQTAQRGCLSAFRLAACLPAQLRLRAFTLIVILTLTEILTVAGRRLDSDWNLDTFIMDRDRNSNASYGFPPCLPGEVASCKQNRGLALPVCCLVESWSRVLNVFLQTEQLKLPVCCLR